MKTNDLDDLFKKKKTSNTSFYLKIAMIVFVIFPLFFIPFFISNWINADNNTYEIETNGEQYEKGNFFKYQGKIYVFTLNDGMQELKNADIATFKPFEPEDYFTQNIALDKNSVYFGNVIIPDLNPNKLKVIGNGYYTDGTNTYFYSPFSELDKDSSKYIFPYKKIEGAKNLKALDNFGLFAVDGDNVYYKGEILNNADLNTLEIIDKNTEYFADKENVYYKSNLLPIKNSGKLKIVSSEHGDKFLYDEVNGYVFIEDYSFDREKAPYKVIGNNGTTLYNLIFIAKDGIYYYDNQKKQQLKAGDNIFIGNIEEITPNVFTDDENIYYFHAYDVSTATKKSIGELISKNTDICYLDKKEGWEKVADIKEASVASIWKKEDKYYYFNNLGIFPFMDNTIYEISDKETLNYLLSKADDKTDDIEELIKNEKLIAVSGEKKMTITVKYKTDIVDKIFKYFIRIFLVAYLIFFIFKEFRSKNEKNNSDETLKFKKKRSSDTIFTFKIISAIILVIVFFIFLLASSKTTSSDSYEIEEKGQRYGNSEFIKYQEKISVAIPSGGRYILDDADINSFRVLNSGDRNTRVIGLDKNSVYFGNIAIPDLDPNKLEVIGNGYYTDGTNTYFCSAVSERNKNLSLPMKVFQSVIYALSKTKKPQTYIYPYKKIDTDKRLKPISDFLSFATDGNNIYYEGEILENVDLNTLKAVDPYHEYFADKENVYYKSKLLPIKNSGKLKIVSSEQGDEFLYDEANGYVFIENYSFDREKAPYKVIGNKGNHLYNLVFVNNEGIYYYNNQKKKQLRAGDNIFVGNVEELSPNVFTDDENIYYFHAYEVQKRLKHSSGYVLASRNTVIYSLGKKDAWEKVNDIESGTVGSIWKKENKYYYFDNLGIFQLIDNAIYEIRDKETLEYLLNYNEGSSKIRELIENEKLIKIEGEKKIEIRVKYTTFFLPFKISGLLAFILGIVIAKVSHYFREKKNAKKF